MFENFKMLSIVLFVAVLQVGCASHTINDPNSYALKALPKTQFFPSQEQIAGKPPRVVVFEADDSRIKLSKRADAGVAIAGVIEQVISKTGAQIIDRDLAGKLKGELVLSEMKGVTGYKGPNVADFAVMSKITSANFSKDFTEARVWTGDDGKRYRSAPNCRFTMKLKGVLLVHELPSLKTVERVELSATASDSRETRSSSCAYSEDEKASLLRTAAEQSAKEAKTKVKNVFSPKGYVIETREKDGKFIVKTTLGASLGAKPGEKVQISQKVAIANSLTGKDSVEVNDIVSGVVSDKIGADYSWVKIKKSENINQLKTGDQVSIFYKASIFDKVGSMTDGLQTSLY